MREEIPIGLLNVIWTQLWFCDFYNLMSTSHAFQWLEKANLFRLSLMLEWHAVNNFDKSNYSKHTHRAMLRVNWEEKAQRRWKRMKNVGRKKMKTITITRTKRGEGEGKSYWMKKRKSIKPISSPSCLDTFLHLSQSFIFGVKQKASAGWEWV